MIYCYANVNKSNSLRMVDCFAKGAIAHGEKVTLVTDNVWRGGPAVFFGVQKEMMALWHKAQGSDWFYIDNGYFNSKWAGGDYYRITKNALQHTGAGVSDGARAKALRVACKPRHYGGVPLVALQSEWWYEFNGTTMKEWLDVALWTMKKNAWPAPIVRSKDEAGTPINWNDTCAVVTHSSNMAVEAIVRGIPAVATGVSPAAGINTLHDWPDLNLPEDRPQWAGVLADNQWNLREIENGTAWKALSR